MKTNFILQKLVALIVLLIFTATVSAQNYYADGLKVLNPNMGNWTKVPGKFESINVTITPAGCYTNYDIVLEISAQGTNLANSPDSLEAEYKFSLPAGVIIHHAVLWMNNIPVKAQLYERNKAKFIYEALVSRRIDPLILYQNEGNTYEARIYPVINPGNRKLQISYLVPNNITSKGIEVPMDLNMFRSDMPAVVPTINVKVANNTLLGTPQYTGNIQATAIGNYDYFTLQGTSANLFLHNAIYFALPPANHFFVSQAETQNEGYYQYMLMPQPNNAIAKNVYVVDYRTVNYINYATVMQVLKNKIRFSLSPLDSFNVVFVNNGGVQKMSQNWISGNDSSIDNAFAGLPANLNSTSSLFFQATCDAISFLNTHGSKGNILIVSNAGSFGNNVSLLNQLIATTTSLMNNNYPVSVFDFNDSFTYAIWNGTEYFFNNQYYFYNLSAVTGGSCFDLKSATYNNYYNANASFISIFSQAIKSLKNLHSYDAVTFTGNSILHSDYKLNNKVLIPLGEAYMETGKYINTPAALQLNYYYGIDSMNYTENFAVNNIVAPDTFTKKIWAYRFIEDLIENNTQGQNSNTIINNSIAYDVLCEYTALLALEPDTAGTVTNENPLATTEVQEAASSDIKAIPNPFSSYQTLEISLQSNMHNQTWELKVYNALGQLVKSAKGKTGFSDQLKIDWYGQPDDAAIRAGLYFIHINIGSYHKAIKVIRQ